jgi:hypothetical protein
MTYVATHPNETNALDLDELEWVISLLSYFSRFKRSLNTILITPRISDNPSFEERAICPDCVD